VDDDPASLGTLASQLQSVGLTVMSARSGEAALRRVQHTRPDLILMDIMMPDIDGLEMCRRLKADPKSQDIPVIFITALTDMESRIRGFSMGAVDYVTKPFQSEEVLARVIIHLHLMKLTRDLQQKNADLERYSRQLEETNRELEIFTSSVSHDLRAPLRMAHGFVGIVLSETTGQISEQHHDYLRRAGESLLRLEKLITSLLNFSRLNQQPIRKELVQTKTVVEQALQSLEAEKIDRQVEIHIGDLPDCSVDATLFKQVWINLLSNALKYTRGRDKAVVEVESWLSGADMVFCVKDNGVGFRKNQAERLFGVFQRLHSESEFEGTGVGLAIAQRIIQRHGGRMWAETEENQGASFFFTLPTGG
jgi:two-component system, sensor histidine kinase and response regulator